MNWEKRLEKTEKMGRLLDRLIERVFILIASVFGAWVTWTVFGAAELGLFVQLGGAAIAAFVCAMAMRVFWFLARFLA